MLATLYISMRAHYRSLATELQRFEGAGAAFVDMLAVYPQQ